MDEPQIEASLRQSPSSPEAGGPPHVRHLLHDATVSVEAHAEVAEGVGEALPPTVEARSDTATLQARTEGRSSGVRGPRRIIDHLVVKGRSLWWTQLTEEGGWLLQVGDEAGEEITTAARYDPVKALAAVASTSCRHPG
jgi:hypothetical protein